MPETEQQDKTLAETVVREAVGMGMESPLRDSILEAVEEADGSTGGKTNLPLAGALFGAGAALGFLAGRQSPELEDTSLEDLQEPEIIEDVVEETTSTAEETMNDDDSEAEMDAEAEGESGSSRLPRMLLVVGLLAGVALIRRRLSADEEDEWEPIEEFEPATSAEPEEFDEEDEMEVDADDEEEEEE
ncbi:hypothetical protein [Natronorubrum texcoconense]|uniref:MYXO-CTERM domain-containing protein n=1 Tax=Natronorubrum texcoconense TaxID=1095776 RepID=A0A1G9DTY1_9EURY|nr:hypothetical protein [Natronorubrum texcoconense]SDK67331.1 hypothetical protein SAMN04515672_3622 [Natronorubrum texcoconense]